MISDLLAGVTRALGAKSTVYVEKIPQKFTPPCFFVKILKPTQEHLLGSRYSREYPLVIHYFDEQDSVEELAKMGDTLSMTLEYIDTAQGKVRGADISWEIQDDVLFFYITYHVFLLKDIPQVPTMAVLEQKESLKKE